MCCETADNRIGSSTTVLAFAHGCAVEDKCDCACGQVAGVATDSDFIVFICESQAPGRAVGEVFPVDVVAVRCDRHAAEGACALVHTSGSCASAALKCRCRDRAFDFGSGVLGQFACQLDVGATGEDVAGPVLQQGFADVCPCDLRSRSEF